VELTTSRWTSFVEPIFCTLLLGFYLMDIEKFFCIIFLSRRYVTMHTVYVITAPILLIDIWILCVCPLASWSLQLLTNYSIRTTNKNDRKVHKTHEKFLSWVEQCQRPTGVGTPLLVVDGNNVRGFGRFEWDPVELDHRVASFCHEYRIPTAVIVWDHGSSKFASMQRYHLSQYSNRNIVCVDTVTVFSGLHQRADDIILAESEFLNSFFYDNQGWSSMAFVTNDRELNFKLRVRSTSTSADSNFLLNRRSKEEFGTKSKTHCMLPSDGPLFCNSCHFVELLQQVPQTAQHEQNIVMWNAKQAISDAEESLIRFSINEGRRSKPRRESTWERCVVAETFRRSLCDSFAMTGGLSVPSSDRHSTDASIISEEFIAQLEESRGYDSPSSIGRSSRADPTISNRPFQGPTRLDKRQRRLLGSYNAFVKRE
jgi:hypothetical protein